MKTAEHRRYDRYLFSMCGLAGLLYGIDVGLIAAALPYIKVTCAFSEQQLASIVAAVLLGGIPGKFIAAQVAERWGRLAAFRLTAVVLAVAVPLVCFSGGAFLPMFAGRILQGIGCGLVGLSAPLYIAECASAEDRGKGTGMIQLVLTIGLVVASLVGYAVAKFFGPADPAVTPVGALNAAWQAIFWFSLLPTVFLFAGSFGLCESPRWLFKKGRLAAARAALLKNNAPPVADTILADLAATACDVRPDGPAYPRETLLQRKYVLPFVLAFLIMCFNQATGINAVLNYSVVLFEKAGLVGSDANLADTAIKFANFAMTIVALALVDRRGRKFLLTLGTAGAVLGLLLVGGLYLALEHGWLAASSSVGWFTAGAFVLFIAGYGVGPGVVVWLVDSELMPLRIRANGMMIAGLGAMATSWVLAQVFLPWTQACGESSVFLTLAGITVFYFLTAAFLLPETKGKSLEEIERHFAGKGVKNGNL